MRFRTISATVGRIIVSGMIAFFVLSLFYSFYYNVPAHFECEGGATDYKWQPNTFYCRATEGFAWGKTNDEGYNNNFRYDEADQIDILIMGSSHMEAFQVAQEESTASRLNKALEGEVVYNIGVSGHTFLTCVGNLEAAIKEYHPTKYIIIETATVLFLDEELSQAVNQETEEILSHAGGIVGFLQKNPFLRTVAEFQVLPLINRLKGINNDNIESGMREGNNIQLLDELLRNISSLAKLSGVKVIIVYHPGTEIDFDGELHLTGSPYAVQQFKELCDSNSIYFLDMGKRFEKEYSENFILPYGFANSSVGKGHLNKYGHAMVADELYRLIMEVE